MFSSTVIIFLCITERYDATLDGTLHTSFTDASEVFSCHLPHIDDGKKLGMFTSTSEWFLLLLSYLDSC